MNDTNVFPEHMPEFPLDDLPTPLVPGGFWDPEDEHRVAAEPQQPDYESMVRSALLASLAVLVSKVVWIVVVANALGILVGIDLWAGIVPYLTLDTTDATNRFATIVTASTIGMGFTAAVLMAWPLVRPGWTRMEILGRAVAVAIVFETWILEAVRQLIAEPGNLIVRWDLAWITLVELVVAGALLALSLKRPRSVADMTGESMDGTPEDLQLILEDRP
jgi:hypothetical protein